MSDAGERDELVAAAIPTPNAVARRHVLNASIAILGATVILAGLGYISTVAFVLPALTNPQPADSSGSASKWSTDVNWADVRPGACLDQSFDWEEYTTDYPFDVNNTGFRIVDCNARHVAFVLLTVDKPLSSTWQKFGASDGVSLDEVDAWTSGICAAAQELLEYSREGQESVSNVGVAKSDGNFAILGHCMLVSRAGVVRSPGDETIDELRATAGRIRSFDP